MLKAATALAGGVARQGETCGALSGAIMALCCLVGREKLEDRDQYDRAMELAARIFREFRKEIGHSLCSEIQRIRYGRSYRLFLPEERQAFHQMGGHARNGCPEVCGVAARLAARTILELKQDSG